MQNQEHSERTSLSYEVQLDSINVRMDAIQAFLGEMKEQVESYQLNFKNLDLEKLISPQEMKLIADRLHEAGQAMRKAIEMNPSSLKQTDQKQATK